MIDKESWLTKKDDWQRKMIGIERGLKNEDD